MKTFYSLFLAMTLFMHLVLSVLSILHSARLVYLVQIVPTIIKPITKPSNIINAKR